MNDHSGTRRDGTYETSTSPWESDTSFEAWHSTPVKNKVAPVLPVDVSNVSLRSENEVAEMMSPVVSDSESSTIQRQRRAVLQLISELKDSDRELNTMAASHRQQLWAREQDRQRLLRQDALQKSVEVIRVMSRQIRAVEARVTDLQMELHLLRQKHQDMDHTSQSLQVCSLTQPQLDSSQDNNGSLISTMMALSSQVRSLQVRQEELSSMFKLKDKHASESTAHMADLARHLQDLEAQLKESHETLRLLRDGEENNRRYRDQNTSLREELQQHVTQSSTQREEIIRLKQEHQVLCRDLLLSEEGESWKEDLLALARSKQDRTDSELHCLLQVFENQQNDLQLLQLHLETAHEALAERSLQEESAGREDTVMGTQNIVEGSREQQQLLCSRVISNSLTAKGNAPNVFPTIITAQKEQREQEESMPGLSLDASSVPMSFCERIHGDSIATCSYLFSGQTNDGLAENARAPNTLGFHSKPGSYNSHQTVRDRSSSGRSCDIWADADLQSTERIEGKVFGRDRQERSTTGTMFTADIQSGLSSTSFEPTSSLVEDPANYSPAADDSDMNCGSISPETSEETMKLDSEEEKKKRRSRTQKVRSPARCFEWTSEACCLLGDAKPSVAILECSVLKHKLSVKNRDATVSLNLVTRVRNPLLPQRSSTDKVTETPPKA